MVPRIPARRSESSLALRQRLGRLLVQAGPLAAAALPGRRLAHVAHGALEPLGLLGDGAEAPALEVGPRVDVALERPPLVAAVHLLDEREVAVAEPLAYGPVARAERLAEPVDAIRAGELVGVLLEERVVLPVEAADLEPAVLLALLHEHFVLAAGYPLEAVHGLSAFRFLLGGRRSRDGGTVRVGDDVPARRRRPRRVWRFRLRRASGPPAMGRAGSSRPRLHGKRTGQPRRRLSLPPR